MQHSPGFLALVADARSRIRECSVAELAHSLGDASAVHLIDVREDHEFARDHLPGARHVGRGVLERDIENAVSDKDAAIILYCGGGFRSALAADNLQRMGYTSVTSLAGGISAWREAGLPLTR